MYVPAILIPIAATAACFYAMFRPYVATSDYDITPIFRLFWLIPISFIWAVYFGISYVLMRLTYPNT